MNQARAIKHDHHHDCCSASSGPRPIADAPEGAIWTCPMHPEIQQVGPGNCPICGMALEPMEPSLDEGPNPELVDFTRRLKVAAVRSEEHTSELQSLMRISYAVFCLKKKSRYQS